MIPCRCVKFSTRLKLPSREIEHLPAFQHRLDYLFLDLNCINTVNLHTEQALTSPLLALGTNINFLHILSDGLFSRPSYMDTHISPNILSIIGQILTPSHQQPIETGRYKDPEPSDCFCFIFMMRCNLLSTFIKMCWSRMSFGVL